MCNDTAEWSQLPPRPHQDAGQLGSHDLPQSLLRADDLQRVGSFRQTERIELLVQDIDEAALPASLIVQGPLEKLSLDGEIGLGIPKFASA